MNKFLRLLLDLAFGVKNDSSKKRRKILQDMKNYDKNMNLERFP